MDLKFDEKGLIPAIVQDHCLWRIRSNHNTYGNLYCQSNTGRSWCAEIYSNQSKMWRSGR